MDLILIDSISRAQRQDLHPVGHLVHAKKCDIFGLATPPPFPDYPCLDANPCLSRITGGMEYHVDGFGPGLTSLLCPRWLYDMRTGHEERVGYDEPRTRRRAL